VAAAGARVDRWLPGRSRRSQFRRDRFHRAHARPDPVLGSTDCLIGGIHVGRADAFRRARLPARFLFSDRIIVPGPISAGERSCVLIGAFVQVADGILISEVIPVRLPDPDPDPFHVVPVPEPDPVDFGLPDPDSFFVHVFADERTSVRIGIRFCLAEGDAESGPCPADRRRP
jgi:hypothetical protein